MKKTTRTRPADVSTAANQPEFWRKIDVLIVPTIPPMAEPLMNPPMIEMKRKVNACICFSGGAVALQVQSNRQVRDTLPVRAQLAPEEHSQAPPGRKHSRPSLQPGRQDCLAIAVLLTRPTQCRGA